MSELVPKRAGFEKTVREYNDRVPMHRRLGIELVQIKPGRVGAVMPFDESMGQQNGYAHAGVLISLADSVAGMAALSLIDIDQDLLSVNIHVSLMRAAKVVRLAAEGQVVKAGKRLMFCEASVWDAADSVGMPLVTASITIAVVER